MKLIIRCSSGFGSSGIGYGEDPTLHECHVAFSGYLVARIMRLEITPLEVFNMGKFGHKEKEFKELTLDLRLWENSIPFSEQVIQRVIETYQAFAQAHHMKFQVIMPNPPKKPHAA